MPLEELSNELLLQILDYLEDKSDVHTLTLCSKRLNILSTPVLYKSFVQGTWKQDLGFTLQLLKHPALGQCVENFTSSSSKYDTSDMKVLGLTAEEKILCQDKLDVLGLSEEEMALWIRDLEDRNWDALMGLILLCTSNVEKLDVLSHEMISMNRLVRVLQNAAHLQKDRELPVLSEKPFHLRPEALNRLRCVTACWYKPLFPIGHAIDFVNLQSVTHAHLTRVFHPRNTSASDLEFYRKSEFSATTLQLPKCFLSGEVLSAFLGGFPQLKELSFSLGGPDYTNDITDRFYGQHFGPLIAHLTHCLEVLRIHIGYHSPTSARPVLGSLTEFKKLRTLSVSAEIVFGYLLAKDNARPRLVDILPKSLRRLEFPDNFKVPVLEGLTELVQRREELVPRLEHIKLDCWTMESDINDPERGSQFDDAMNGIYRILAACKLEELCDAAGVRCDMNDQGNQVDFGGDEQSLVDILDGGERDLGDGEEWDFGLTQASF